MIKLALLAVSLGFCSTNAHADAITGGVYYEFHFDGVGSFSSTCSSACTQPTDPTALQVSGTAPYTFGLATSTNFIVQDLLLGGDRFAVYNYGVLLGNTSATVDGASCGGDIGLCSTTAGISKGSFAIGPGNYSITIKAIQSDSGGGSAVFEVAGKTVAATPEPSSIALLGTGLLGIVGAVRRRISA